MANIIDKVIATAKSQVGYKEGKNNWNKYSEYFDNKPIWQFFNTKKQNTAYCAVGLHWCLCQNIDPDKVRTMLGEPSPKSNCGAGCKYLYNYITKKTGTQKTPVKGAFIFFKTKDSKGKEVKYGHVEIITAVDSKIHTVGFNKSGSVNVKECSYALNSTKISGYALPDYKSVEPEPTPTPTPTPSKDVVKAKHSAESFNKSISGSYKVNTQKSPLNMRDGAGTNFKILTKIPKGATVKCYGYYTEYWYFVRYETATTIYEGFCNKTYLKKV